MATPPPLTYPKGGRRELDAAWLDYLSSGGVAGEGGELRGLASFRDGVEGFNGGRYFDAHELFEDAWRQSNYPHRLLAHALSKLAATYLHEANGKRAVALKLALDVTRLLTPLPPTYAGIAVNELRADIGHWRTGAARDVTLRVTQAG